MMKKILKTVEYFLLFLLLAYFVLTTFFLGLLFKNSYKTGDLTFYYNNPINYGIRTEEQLKNFYKCCDEISKELLDNPFYVKKKINIVLCDSYTLFNIFNPTSTTSMGTSVTYFNYSRIIITKSDLVNYRVISSFKDNNQRNLKTVLKHELTHSYITKFMSLLTGFTTPTWKEEGICEVVAGDSTYNINEGIKRLLDNNPDKNQSWKYFTYRMCVTYMIKHDKLSFEEVIKDKRKLKDVLSQLYLLTESELRELI